MNSTRVAVTGAAGQISYSLLFRLASGEVFGRNTRVHLNLIELPVAVGAAEGVALELQDCAYSTLGEVNCYDNATQGFSGVDWALLIGAKPRGPGMERSDLIKENGAIFVDQGRALIKANPKVTAIVVGNPCNTNALIAMHAAKDIPPRQFTAMTMLDENRARAQLGQRAKTPSDRIDRLFIWGNHSPTMYPDFENAKIGSSTLEEVIRDRDWLCGDFLSTVQQRGAEIIRARGASSAASAASACIDQIKFLNTEDKCFSCVVASDGNYYDVPKGLMFSFPVRSSGKGSYEILDDIDLSTYAREKIRFSVDELLKERDLVRNLL